jgi:hypothetical protein
MAISVILGILVLLFTITQIEFLILVCTSTVFGTCIEYAERINPSFGLGILIGLILIFISIYIPNKTNKEKESI